MEMWNTDTDCYLYDKDMYDDVCFARTMLKDNLEALRKGSAPPQVRTVIWCGFPSSFFSFLFFPKGRISSLSSFPTTSIIICLAFLSLALPRSPSLSRSLPLSPFLLSAYLLPAGTSD